MKRLNRRRRGAALPLILAMIVVQFIVAALVVNWTYINTTRRQLRAAADASAKASLTMLALRQNVAQARRSGIDIAARHTVGRTPLQLANRDIVFGRTTVGGNGAYTFAPNVQPYNSARVQAGAPNVATLLGSFLGRDRFSLAASAIATRVDNDICLVLDRSGSMAWDASANEFRYPSGVAGLTPLQQYFEPPHPTASRWAALLDAVDVFFSTLDQRDPQAHVALVTFASDFEFGAHQSVCVSTDQPLTASQSAVLNAARQYGQTPIIGDTNPGAGLQEAADVLNGRRGGLRPRVTAHKTILLFTDGLKTEGPDPVTIAAALDAGFTVHTVTFSAGADQTLMQRVAAARNGIHVHASTPSALADAFRKIAEQIPNVLTQ
jgi:hypothetical protein